MNSCSVTISYSFDFEVQLRIQVFGSSHKEAPGLTFCETPKQEFSGADTNLQFSEGNFDIRCCKTAQFNFIFLYFIPFFFSGGIATCVVVVLRFEK